MVSRTPGVRMSALQRPSWEENVPSAMRGAGPVSQVEEEEEWLSKGLCMRSRLTSADAGGSPSRSKPASIAKWGLCAGEWCVYWVLSRGTVPRCFKQGSGFGILTTSAKI
jgi:hypothetical protein